MSVEVDLSKPLLSKFRLHGRVWKIQYEGLRLICFKCGKIGHKEENCPLSTTDDSTTGQQPAGPNPDPTVTVPPSRPEYLEEFGSWMLVRKPSRKKTSQTGNGSMHDKNGPLTDEPGLGSTNTGLPTPKSHLGNNHHRAKNFPQQRKELTQAGSRFAALYTANNMEDNMEGELSLQEADITSTNLILNSTLETNPNLQNQGGNADTEVTPCGAGLSATIIEPTISQNGPQSGPGPHIGREQILTPHAPPAQQYTGLTLPTSQAGPSVSKSEA